MSTTKDSPTGYIRRSLEPVLQKAARQFPVVQLTGPRQSGKTTLLKRLFGESHRYVSLEPPDVRQLALRDPRAFLEAHPPPVILDEVQHAPALLPYIQERVDARRSARGQYVLTGSQNLLLSQHVTESLAGRTAILRLLPLSCREIAGHPLAALPWEGKPEARAPLPISALWESVLRGGYPEPASHPGQDLALWHTSYVQTYLERDVRTLRQVGDLSQFQAFLTLLAARSGQLLSLTDISRDLGVALNTIKAWLSVLEATYQVLVLRPHHANLGKRLVKTPKVYFTDTGTLCHLTGVGTAAHAASGPMAGALLETLVVMEVVKAFTHRGEVPRVHFWRTGRGEEVDLVIDTGHGLVPVEVKCSATPAPRMAAGIEAFRKAAGKKALKGYVVHPGGVHLPLGDGVEALPFSRL